MVDGTEQAQAFANARKFTKKPVTIEAVQFLGDVDAPEIVALGIKHSFEHGADHYVLVVPTNHGDVFAQPSDWIIRSVDGELYPCKDSVFQATYAPNGEAQGLPVAGYRPQSEHRLALVNANKEAEERILRILDGLAAEPDIDRRWFSIGRTAIEQGFMAVNRAVFQPGRVTLPEDATRTPSVGAQDTRSRGEPRP